MATSFSWRTSRFIIAQTAPPLLMFYVAFGTWNIGTAVFLSTPLLIFSVVSFFWKLHAKAPYRLLLRPTLTIIFASTILGMGRYYSIQSKEYVKQLAQSMQQQCGRFCFCTLPIGDWKKDNYYPALFHSNTPGFVSMRLDLTFNEHEAEDSSKGVKSAQCESDQNKLTTGSTQFRTFRLVRRLEDADFEARGGVGRSLELTKED